MVGIPKTLHISEHYPDRMGAWMAGILKTQPHFRTFFHVRKIIPLQRERCPNFHLNQYLRKFQNKMHPGQVLGCSLHRGALQSNKLERKVTSAPGLAMSHLWVICDSVPVLVYAQRV